MGHGSGRAGVIDGELAILLTGIRRSAEVELAVFEVWHRRRGIFRRRRRACCGQSGDRIGSRGWRFDEFLRADEGVGIVSEIGEGGHAQAAGDHV